jgi:hypothetical protein
MIIVKMVYVVIGNATTQLHKVYQLEHVSMMYAEMAEIVQMVLAQVYFVQIRHVQILVLLVVIIAQIVLAMISHARTITYVATMAIVQHAMMKHATILGVVIQQVLHLAQIDFANPHKLSRSNFIKCIGGSHGIE